MVDASTSIPDVPTPNAYRLTVPASAAAPLADVPAVVLRDIAAFLVTVAWTLRSRAARDMDGCMNRGTCRTDQPGQPCCLLCAFTDAFTRSLPANASTAQACNLAQACGLAKQLTLDTIDANPAHGGEVFVLEHLASLVRTATLTPRENA